MIRAFVESEELARAAEVAQAFLVHGAAWGAGPDVSPSASDYEYLMLNVLEAAGQRPHADAAARRKALFDAARAKGSSPQEAWSSSYGAPMNTLEARDALAMLDKLGLGSKTGWDIAEIFVWTDEGERGRPALEATTRACDHLSSIRGVLHAELALGRLDQAAGNVPSACAHYAKILSHGGHAKPRSVTADEARSRSQALGCPAP